MRLVIESEATHLLPTATSDVNHLLGAAEISARWVPQSMQKENCGGNLETRTLCCRRTYDDEKTRK